ncbi:NAD(P)-binding protein [Hysterangium stoloniferum]|nr:NAD(P)-binding protein [Hysterangium stoloniferum]
MSPVRNPRVVFNAIPKHYPIPGDTTVYDTSRTIDLDSAPLNGGYLTKTLSLSPEPWLRERLRAPDVPSYSTPMRLGHTFVSFGLVKVLRSEDENVKEGEYYIGIVPWEAYTVHPWEGKQLAKPGQWPTFTTDVDAIPFMKVEKHPAMPWTLFMGALGVPGQTAWMGLKEYGNLKPGETIYVSTAAGAVGIMVVQLAKLAGLKVIASTSSDEKVKYLKSELGVDEAFNYKTTPVDEALAKYGPIDVYWDNVGGKALDAAIENANMNARILSCGYISEYNNEEAYGVKNLAWLFKKCIKIYGFLQPELMVKWLGKFMEEVPLQIATGQIKTKEHVVYGLENADKAWVEMFEGKNIGKTVVIVAEDN